MATAGNANEPRAAATTDARSRWILRWVASLAVLVLVTTVPAAAGAAPSDDVWTQRRVLNIAHAGGDLEAPHSTLYAMKTAVAAGTDVLEMDLRLSADGVLMAHHDVTLDRTTEASGPMGDRTVAELQELDNAYWFVPNCWSCRDRPPEEYRFRGVRTGAVPPPKGFAPTDFTIPTLAEVADTFPNRILDVEIKDGPTGMAAAEALAGFIADNGPADRYVVASFDDSIMARFKELAPDVATSPGIDETTAWFLTRGELPDHDVIQVPPEFSGLEVVTQDFVDDAHAAGVAVWVWFNGTDDDSPETWQRLIDLGVDGLLTGKPATAQSVIDANGLSYAVAPELGATLGRKGRNLHGELHCPASHVATCSSRLVLVARRPNGALRLVGVSDVAVARSRTEAVEVRLEPGPWWRLGGPRSRPIYALLFPLDSDTAPTLVAVTVTR